MKILAAFLFVTAAFGQLGTGQYQRLEFGPTWTRDIISNGVTNYAMGTTNAGWCGRFTAKSTLDVKAVKLYWQSVTAAAAVSLRIETIDATSGKPSGNLYDANAAFTITTPAAGSVQTYTFASLPTTGLTVGNEYCVLLLTTGSGTQSLYSSDARGAYPEVVLTAANGTTRSTFAEVSNGWPVMALVYEDNSEEQFGTTASTAFACYGTRSIGVKFNLSTSMQIQGVQLQAISRAGTPTGDLRVRVFDNAGNAVAGAARTMDKDSLTGAASKNILATFATPITLTPGAYRAVVDQTDHASTAGNNFSVYTIPFFSPTSVPTGFYSTSTTNIDGAPVTWTDDNTTIPGMILIMNDVPSVSTGGNYAVAQ